MLDVLKELETEKFHASLHKCFVTVGLLPGADGKYLEYSATRKGSVEQLFPQSKTDDSSVSVGEIASELAMTKRSGVPTIQPVATTGTAGAGSSTEAPEEEEEFTEDESDAHSSDDEKE